MPILDEHIERAVRDAAPVVDTEGVLDRVAIKRARRRSMRRLEGAAAALALAAVLVGATALLLRDDADDARVTTPAAPTSDAGPDVPTATITEMDGRVRKADVALLDTDEGYLRAPISIVGSTVSLATYERDGATFTFPPSHVVRFSLPSLRVEQRVDLKAEVLSIADGEGVRWVVTRNPAPPNGLPDAFLKRIEPDGSVAASVLLPPPADPVGDIVAIGGTVWVPLRDGVLPFDIATGRFSTPVRLATADLRSVVPLGDSVRATNGSGLQRVDGIDPLHDLALQILRSNETIVSATSAGAGAWIVAQSAESGAARSFVVSPDGTTGVSHTLPRGFGPNLVRVVDGRTWIGGVVEGSPAVALIKAGGKVSTVVLDGPLGTSFAWADEHTVLAVSGGRLLRIEV